MKAPPPPIAPKPPKPTKPGAVNTPATNTTADAVAAGDGAQTYHVFVDYSNILFGAQSQAGQFNHLCSLNSGRGTPTYTRAPPLSFCTAGAGVKALSTAALVRLVEDGRNVATRVVAGSTTTAELAAGADPFALWETCGYTTQVHRNRTAGEQFVDQALQSSITAVLQKVPTPGRHHTLVLLSGDGNEDVEGAISFPKVLEFGIRLGFRVEVWAWRGALSHKHRLLATRYPASVTIHLLDDHAGALRR